jgi:rod shape-determining protein MreB
MNLSRFNPLRGDVVCVDLGTFNTRFKTRESTEVFSIPSFVLIDNSSGSDKIVDVGHAAFELLGKPTEHQRCERPLDGGYVQDVEKAAKFLELAVKKFYEEHLKVRRGFAKAIVAIGVPTDTRPALQRNTADAARRGLNACEVILLDEGINSAIGSGVDIFSKHAVAVIDMGGGTCDIVVTINGQSVQGGRKRVDVGGVKMNKAVVQYMDTDLGWEIGPAMAEKIKNEIGFVFEPNGSNASIPIYGVNKALQRHGMFELHADKIFPAFDANAAEVTHGVNECLRDIPKDMSQDIFDRGFCCAGGMALMKKWDDRFQKDLQLVTTVAPDPINCGINGIAKANELGLLRRLSLASSR